MKPVYLQKSVNPDEIKTSLLKHKNSDLGDIITSNRSKERDQSNEGLETVITEMKTNKIS